MSIVRRALAVIAVLALCLLPAAAQEELDEGSLEEDEDAEPGDEGSAPQGTLNATAGPEAGAGPSQARTVWMLLSGHVLLLAGLLALRPVDRVLAQSKAAGNVRTVAEVKGAVGSLVTVTGRVTPEDPVSEPEAGVPECLWYRVEWQELREVGDHDMWVTEESDDDECDFSLEDDTGAIWVDNTNAEVKGASRLDRSIGSDERVTGSFLPVAETLTVVGRVVIDPEDKRPMLGPDPDAGLVISTGSPSELGRAERARAASYVLMGSFLCLAGLGLLAGGYLGLL